MYCCACFSGRSRLQRVVFGTLAATAALGFLHAADAPPPTLTPVAVSNTGSIDTTPSEKRLQEVAQEILDISVKSVKTAPLKSADVGPGSLSVMAEATILSVLRTSTNLKAGDKITIAYTHVDPLPGKSAPMIVPVIKEGAEYIAYLFGPLPNGYAPFAGTSSFTDPSAIQAPDQGHAAPASASDAVADPDLLPTPQNPAPAAVIKMTGESLKKWALINHEGGKWTVSLANVKLPLPLQVSANATPAPVSYYLAPLRAPLTQPTVFIYQAGAQDTGNPVLGVVNVERALIIDRQGHLLGDVLWAFRTDKNVLVPLPTWTWLPYKLEVEDPFDKNVQHISLISTDETK